MLFCNSWLEHADQHDVVKQHHAGYVSHIRSRNGTVCIIQTFALAMKLSTRIGWLMVQDYA